MANLFVEGKAEAFFLVLGSGLCDGQERGNSPFWYPWGGGCLPDVQSRKQQLGARP